MNSWPQKLAQSAPDVSAVMAMGLTRSDAEVFVSRFRATRHERSIKLPDVDPILTLFDEWDLSQIKIGQLAFHEIPLFHKSGEIEIGSVEADPLIVSQGGGELRVQELGQSHLLWKVASSSKSLLDALIPAAKFLGERSIGLIDFDNFDAARETAETCSQLAGGKSYRDFFMMLLGAEE